MDLKKFKLISAVLLAGALLFLSVIMIINKSEADNLPFSAAEDLSALFAVKGVELPPEVVPLKREKLPVYSLPAADGAIAQKIAETVSASTRVAANLTKDGYLFRLENGGMLEISKSLLFEYTLKNSPVNESGVTYPPTDTAMAKADALISRFTAETDTDDDLICTYKLKEYAPVGSNTLLRFNVFLNGAIIEGNALTVYQNADGEIIQAKGTYAFSALKKENGFKHYDIINVLKTEFDSIAENHLPENRIVSIGVCYVMRRFADEGRIFLVPAWKIEYADGTSKLYESAYGETR